MGSTEMGGHWSTEEERKVSAVWEKQRLETKVSKMRPTCKSHTNDKRAKGQKASAVKRKRAAGNPGGKPTNVKTFA